MKAPALGISRPGRANPPRTTSGRSWRCRNVDIARHLGISRASVSKALVKLSEAGLVEVVDHDVGFTPEGRAIAEATSARHRFFERLLRDAGVAADEASRDACRLEHCVSADSFEKLYSHLTRSHPSE